MRRKWIIAALVAASLAGDVGVAEARGRCRGGGCELSVAARRERCGHGGPVRRALGWLLLRGGRRC